MNVTFNSSNYANSNYNFSKKYPSFKAAQIPAKSAFFKQIKKILKPFETGMDVLTDGISKNYTARMWSNRVTNKLSTLDVMGQIVDHMQFLGSVIISGMYMIMTLRNQNMDDDRKKTLAINQGLTFVASSAIAYLISERLIGPWNEHVAAKLAAKELNLSSQVKYDPEKLAKMSHKEKKAFFKNENIRLLNEELEKHRAKIKRQYFEKHSEDIKLENVDLKAQRSLYDKEIKQGKNLPEFNKYLQDLLDIKSTKLEIKGFKKPNLIHYVDEGLKNTELTKTLKSLDVLKSLLIFGSVYRFIGPVVVTPIANKIGNKFFSKDDKKAVIVPLNETKQNVDTAEKKQSASAEFVSISQNKPKLSDFLNNIQKSA